MRRHVKNKLLEKLNEMGRMHGEIARAYEAGEYDRARELLAQRQEDAILVGNTIEAQSEGVQESDCAAIVQKLEDYCEALYACASGIRAYESAQFDRMTDDVAAMIKERIAGRREVAFFPYKASMWDSLESIWRAADADADCDAYVVPIPYFDRNEEKAFVAMHYEGDQFPPYVPIVRWEEYRTEKRRPDVIYIHNPYDNANKVTSVHPDFYAKELKRHTDLLVYVPYFVCLHHAVPPALCLLPGVLHADRVMVQSERVRDIYIREFHKFEDEYHCHGAFGDAKEKFVALGSPKYDRVIAAGREAIEIPESWRAIIERDDGSRRRVLLYNTSVTGILRGEADVLRKIAAVFARLKGDDAVALLWRPHPLSETTCAAMRPELIAAYHQLVETYQKENWGIYDDTTDLHRAIALSDAYYGDMSSLVELYRLTGKPILIQNLKEI